MGYVWAKFGLNCALNPPCALTGLRPGEIARHRPTVRLLERLLDEVIAIAAAQGVRLPDPDVWRHVLDHAFQRYNRLAMLQDIESGRRTEIEAPNGALVREACNLGLAVPDNEAIWAAVSGMDERHTRTPILDEAALEAAAQHAQAARNLSGCGTASDALGPAALERSQI